MNFRIFFSVCRKRNEIDKRNFCNRTIHFYAVDCEECNEFHVFVFLLAEEEQSLYAFRARRCMQTILMAEVLWISNGKYLIMPTKCSNKNLLISYLSTFFLNARC